MSLPIIEVSDCHPACKRNKHTLAGEMQSFRWCFNVLWLRIGHIAALSKPKKLCACDMCDALCGLFPLASVKPRKQQNMFTYIYIYMSIGHVCHQSLAGLSCTSVRPKAISRLEASQEKGRLVRRVGHLGRCFVIGSGAGRKGPAPGRIPELRHVCRRSFRPWRWKQ